MNFRLGNYHPPWVVNRQGCHSFRPAARSVRTPMKNLTSLGRALLLVGTCFLGEAAEPKVGIATLDITPPLGCSLAGYYHERRADGILDPLFSKAIVLEQDGERVAFV